MLLHSYCALRRLTIYLPCVYYLPISQARHWLRCRRCLQWQPTSYWQLGKHSVCALACGGLETNGTRSWLSALEWYSLGPYYIPCLVRLTLEKAVGRIKSSRLVINGWHTHEKFLSRQYLFVFVIFYFGLSLKRYTWNQKKKKYLIDTRSCQFSLETWGYVWQSWRLATGSIDFNLRYAWVFEGLHSLDEAFFVGNGWFTASIPLKVSYGRWKDCWCLVVVLPGDGPK